MGKKFKVFADEKFKVAEMAEFVHDRVENIMGKGENAGGQHFLLFLQCFQKAFGKRLRICKNIDSFYLLKNQTKKNQFVLLTEFSFFKL